MFKRFVALLLLSTCLLTGCAAQEYTVSFSEDGSSIVSAGAYFSDEFFTGLGMTPTEFFQNTTLQNGAVREDRVIDGTTYYGAVYSMNFSDISTLHNYMSDPLDQYGLPSSMGFDYSEYIDDGIVYLQICGSTLSYEQFTEELSRQLGGKKIPDLRGKVVYTLTYKFPYGVRDIFDIPDSAYIRNGDTITIDIVTSEPNDYMLIGALRKATSVELERTTTGTLANFEPAREYAGQFYDVDYDEWYSEAVRYVYSCSLIEGKSEHAFAPNDNLTVAETLALVDRVYCTYNDELIHPVECRDWYDTYVAYAMQHGIINGTEFSDYNTPITRAQAAYLLARAIHEDDLQPMRKYKDFTDCSYDPNVALLYCAGIIDGMTATTFHPDAYLTRAQAATLIYRMICPNARGN